MAFHKKKKEAELLVCLEFESQLTAAGLSYVGGNKYVQNPQKKVKEDKSANLNLYSRLIQQAKDAITGYCNLHKITEPPIQYSSEGPPHDLTHICSITLPNYDEISQPTTKTITVSSKLKKKATQFTYIKAAIELSLMNAEQVRQEPEIWNYIYPEKMVKETVIDENEVNTPSISVSNQSLSLINTSNQLLSPPEIISKISSPQIPKISQPQPQPIIQQQIPKIQQPQTEVSYSFDSHPELDPRIALYNSIKANKNINNISEKRKLEEDNGDDKSKKQKIENTTKIIEEEEEEKYVNNNIENENEYTDVRPVMPIMDIKIENNIEPPAGVIINIQHPTACMDYIDSETTIKNNEDDNNNNKQSTEMDFSVNNPDKITSEQVLAIIQMIAN